MSFRPTATAPGATKGESEPGRAQGRAPGSSFPTDVSDRPFALPNKYGAKVTFVDGIRFDSKAEAARYRELQLLERSGQIRKLERQPVFQFFVSGHRKPIFRYRADFAYFEDNKRVIEDVKGVRTPLYKLKKKLIEAEYHIEIREIGA